MIELQQKVAEANLEERARKLATHLLTTAWKRTPQWERSRIREETEWLIRTYESL